MPDLRFVLYFDGGCTIQDEQRPGSWAFHLVAFNEDWSVATHADGRPAVTPGSGKANGVTAPQMELTAAIQGMKALKKSGVKLTIVCDAEYVRKAFTEGWSRKKNPELFAQLQALVDQHTVTWKHVDGHQSPTHARDIETQTHIEWNNKTDKLCRAAR
jgi:ribonuclease HI